MLALLFMLPSIDGASAAAPPVRPAAAVAAPAPTYNGAPLAIDTTPVEIAVEDGLVARTGKVEAEVAAIPIDDEAAYRAEQCAQLREAKPWIDWPEDCIAWN